MGDHEDEIPEMSSPPHEVREEDPTITYDASHEQPSWSGYDPSFMVAGIGFRVTRLTMNPQALVMLDMAFLISLSLIHHIMLSWKFTLALWMGTLRFISMRRGLGALVTLHLPSLWWRRLHMLLLGLVLVILLRYQDRDEWTLGRTLIYLHISLCIRTPFLWMHF